LSADEEQGSGHRAAEVEQPIIVAGRVPDEHVATSSLSLTDSKALNEANITPTVLVTCKKAPSIAVCTFGAPFWELIGTAKMIA
jgi:hypothetical protein